MLFNDVCLFQENYTIIYGQYQWKDAYKGNHWRLGGPDYNWKPSIENIENIEELEFSLTHYHERPDFYIKIRNKINNINEITFKVKGGKVIIKNISLYFPFENCELSLNNESAIISTMCKDYSSRLEEWIQYNLKLGFSGIVIFDNDENKNNELNESLEYHQNNNISISDICKKYKGKVHYVKFNYKPLPGNHWNFHQRISLHIGINAFRNKCGKIALIDADEFIHIPNKSNIMDFLADYKGQTITIQSNILTNKSDNDIINNNILDLCVYVGENKYTKTIIDTSQIQPLEFIMTPHNHPTQIPLLEKDEIIHYHCWVNSRYKYNEYMKKIDFLKNN